MDHNTKMIEDSMDCQPVADTIYLTPLEEEKINELNKIQKDYLDKASKLGDLTIALKVAESEALQAYSNLKQADSQLLLELENKYGKGFKLNGNEVIPGN